MRSPALSISLLIARGFLSAMLWLPAAAAAIWASLAIVVGFPIQSLRWPLGAAFAAVALVAALKLRKRPFASAAVLLASAAPAFLWWLALTPRNDRRWQPEMTRTPWAEISGDLVALHNFRNTAHRTLVDFTPRWETRTFHLSALKHLDLHMVYWGSPHVCHTMMTFDFGSEGRVCASIEARREWNESYSPLAGLFRRHELLYVLGDERDLIRLRAGLPGGTEQVYLFRLSASPALVQAIFRDYLVSTNSLHEKAAWYHSLTDNCSTLIRKHITRFHRDAPWDWRLIANGHIDARLYEQGHIDRSLPLASLKKRSLINPAALAAGDSPDFSDRIRAGLPAF